MNRRYMVPILLLAAVILIGSHMYMKGVVQNSGAQSPRRRPIALREAGARGAADGAPARDRLARFVLGAKPGGCARGDRGAGAG